MGRCAVWGWVSHTRKRHACGLVARAIASAAAACAVQSARIRRAAEREVDCMPMSLQSCFRVFFARAFRGLISRC